MPRRHPLKPVRMNSADRRLEIVAIISRGLCRLQPPRRISQDSTGKSLERGAKTRLSVSEGGAGTKDERAT